MPEKTIAKDVVFDGVNFYLCDKPIGKIRPSLRFKTPIDKEILDREKCNCLGKIMNIER